MVETEQFRRKLVRADMTRMNLPEEYWTVKVARVAESVRPAVARYVRKLDEMVDSGVGLLIHGSKGVGKTSIAAGIAMEARSRGYTAFFCQLWEIREMLRSRISFDDDTSLMTRMREVDILVLDGLREEDAIEKFFSLSDIRELIRSRQMHKQVTLVTTRLGPADLKGPLMRAFTEDCQGVLVAMAVDGPNLREEFHLSAQKAVFED